MLGRLIFAGCQQHGLDDILNLLDAGRLVLSSDNVDGSLRQLRQRRSSLLAQAVEAAQQRGLNALGIKIDHATIALDDRLRDGNLDGAVVAVAIHVSVIVLASIAIVGAKVPDKTSSEWGAAAHWGILSLQCDAFVRWPLACAKHGLTTGVIAWSSYLLALQCNRLVWMVSGAVSVGS